MLHVCLNLGVHPTRRKWVKFNLHRTSLPGLIDKAGRVIHTPSCRIPNHLLFIHTTTYFSLKLLQSNAAALLFFLSFFLFRLDSVFAQLSYMNSTTMEGPIKKPRDDILRRPLYRE